MSTIAKKIKKYEIPMESEIIFLPYPEASVAELAYCKAEQRGFEPGHELDDWLEAEKELSL